MGDGSDNPGTFTGPPHNGLGNRGIGPTAGLGGKRVAQQEPKPGSRAPGPLETLLEQVDAELGKAVLQNEQKQAEALVDALRPHFLNVFSVRGKPFSPRIGGPLAVKVLDAVAFTAVYDEEKIEEWEETYDAMFKYAYENFERKFLAIQRRGGLQHTYSTVPKRFTDLGRDDARLILPRPPVTGRVGGFWSPRKGTMFIKLGQLDGGIAAHEMCHAYGSKNWNDLIVLFAAWDLGKPAARLDEGVTSELADLVIGSWMPAPPSPSGGPMMVSASRRPGLPSGYGGYGIREKLPAHKLFGLLDGLNEPGPVTLQAYFGGRVSSTINKKTPARSLVNFAGKRVVFGDLIVTDAP